LALHAGGPAKAVPIDPDDAAKLTPEETQRFVQENSDLCIPRASDFLFEECCAYQSMRTTSHTESAFWSSRTSGVNPSRTRVGER
jgi:hypothetical protein